MTALAVRSADMGVMNANIILKAVEARGPISTEDLVVLIGLSPRHTRIHLRALCASGQVVRVGHKWKAGA